MKFKEYFLVVENIDTKIPILIKQFGNIPFFKGYDHNGNIIKDVLKSFAALSDPTPDAKYITWILRMNKNGSLRGFEDSSKTKERLRQFDKLKRTPRFTGPKDINQYKTFADLAQTLDKFEGVVSKGEEHRIKEDAGTKLLGTNDNISMYMITNVEAASRHFRHTEWCVKDPEVAERYIPKGSFYFFTKDNKPLYLAHFGTDQFRDTYDNLVDNEDLDNMDTDDNGNTELGKVHALISTLPEYKQLMAAAENFEEAGDVVHDFIEAELDNMGDLSTITGMLKERNIDYKKATIKQVKQVIQTYYNGISQTAYETAAGGMLDDDSEHTEFATLLTFDNIHVNLQGESWDELASEFQEQVGDRISDIYPNWLKTHLPRIMTGLKTYNETV